ncbi:MAG TPA: HD domain-containing protein [Acidimicrobiales bacterium]|nr:HD domain-containing protein [Acidimicrobiales bacterium]
MESERCAQEYARSLLAADPERLAHTQAVVNRASSLSKTLLSDAEDRAALVAAAWLHDIGYSPQLVKTGAHHLDGARHLSEHGEERLAGLVAYHGSGEAEATLRGFAAEFAEFPREPGLVSDILTYCDLTAGPAGCHVELAERLSEVRARYGDDHVVVRGLDASSELIQGAFLRVETAMASAS